MERFTIDGNNVCWWYSHVNKNEMSAKPLFALIEAILNNKDDFYCVFDASIYNDLKKYGNDEEKDFLTKLINDFSNNFYIVTASTRADGVVLNDADYYNNRVISNDIYKDYKEKYSWLSDKHTERLIQGNFQRNGAMILDKLKYGKIRINDNIQRQVENINHKLKNTSNKEVGSLENEIAKRKEILNNLQKEIDERNRTFEKLESDTEALITKEKSLTRSIADLNKSKIRFQKESQTARGRLLEVDKKLQEANLVTNFNEIYQDKKDQINKLDKIIEEKKLETETIEKEKKDILKKYQEHEKILRKNNELERRKTEKKFNERECIQNASNAIKGLLSQYGIKHDKWYPGRELLDFYISFNGSSWETAVKKLELSFKKNPICEDCFERASGYGCHICGSCGSKNVTNNPSKIWEVINEFAPKK